MHLLALEVRPLYQLCNNLLEVSIQLVNAAILQGYSITCSRAVLKSRRLQAILIPEHHLRQNSKRKVFKITVWPSKIRHLGDSEHMLLTCSVQLVLINAYGQQVAFPTIGFAAGC